MEWAFTTGLRTSSVVAMFLLNAACKAEIVTNVPRKPTGFGNLAYSVDPLEGEEALRLLLRKIGPKEDRKSDESDSENEDDLLWLKKD